MGLHPIVIDDKNQLIAGQLRLGACQSLGWENVPVHVVPLNDIVRGEFDENTVRSDFLPSEMDAISKKLEERERQAAKRRQGGGIGHATMAKIAEVCEAAEAEPQKYQPLVDEMDRTRRVNGVHRKLKVAKQVEQRTA